MARKVIVEYTDDLGSAGAASTQRFSLNGQEYVIDLNKRNAETLERHMAKYIKVARPVQTHVHKGSNQGAIRSWAKAQGMEVGMRGQMPAEVVAAYNEAHPADPAE